MILIGSTKVVGQQLQLVPPTGFNSVQAVRLSNFADNPVILNNVSGIDQSQQYLMPVQCMVYSSSNVSNPPTIQPTGTDTAAGIATKVLVEWSTDPQTDFQGTYPAPIMVPADVVAQAIFAQGVPNVLTETTLFNGTVAAGNTIAPIPVSGYASIDLILSVSSSPTSVPGACGIQLSSSDSLVISGFGMPSPPSFSFPYYWQIPVTSGSLIISNLYGATNVNVQAVGTNRPVTQISVLGNVYPRRFAFTGAYTAGVDVTLVASDGYPAASPTPRDYSARQGPCTLQFFNSTTAIGSLFYQWVDVSGSIQQVFFPAQAAGTRQTYQFEHPPAYLRWGFHPIANAAATTITLDIAGHQ